MAAGQASRRREGGGAFLPFLAARARQSVSVRGGARPVGFAHRMPERKSMWAAQRDRERPGRREGARRRRQGEVPERLVSRSSAYRQGAGRPRPMRSFVTDRSIGVSSRTQPGLGPPLAHRPQDYRVWMDAVAACDVPCLAAPGWSSSPLHADARGALRCSGAYCVSSVCCAGRSGAPPQPVERCRTLRSRALYRRGALCHHATRVLKTQRAF